MKNIKNKIYENYDIWFSCCPDDVYPEEDVPYSCSEEAEAYEQQQAFIESLNQYSQPLIQQ